MSSFEIVVLVFVFVALSVILRISSAGREIGKIKAQLAGINGKLDALLKSADVKYDPFPNLSLSQDIQSAVRNGRKIEAIKLYRQETGAGLAESKRMIDSIMP
jgi:hypothetical protein